MITTVLADPLSLLTVSLLGFLLCALIGGLLSSFISIRPFAACGTLAFSLIGLLASAEMFFSPRHQAVLAPLHLHVEVSGLHAFFLFVIMLSGIWAALYNIGALLKKTTGDSAWQALFINLMLATLSAAVVANDLISFLIFFEAAALSGYFLIVRNTGDKGVRAGQSQLLLTQLGMLFLVIAAAVIHSHVHSFSFTAIRAAHLPEATRNSAFILSLIGFGAFAGIMPFHGWVPQSHSSASPSAAMMFSAGLLKVGLFGILLVGLDLLGIPPLWWGVLVLVLGLVTAFFGGLYALQEHDIRRLLAYHSLESTGIILLGLGAAMAGLSVHQPILTAFGLIGALFQILNHNLFGSALFLGAGVVENRTGLKDIEKMGGLARLMPVTAISILTGLGAMAALPPLNGFVSEWLIYQGLFHFSAAPHFVSHLFGPLLAVGLALTGALAVMCASKVFGIAFLGAARSDAAKAPRPGNPFEVLSCAAPAVLCVAFGLAAPWIIPVFARLTGFPDQGHSFAATLVCTPLITILLLALPVLPILFAAIYRSDRPTRRVGGTAWSCGYDYDKAMNMNATSVAQPVRVMFEPFYALRRILPKGLGDRFHGKTFVSFCRGTAAVGLAGLLIVIVTFA